MASIGPPRRAPRPHAGAVDCLALGHNRKQDGGLPAVTGGGIHCNELKIRLAHLMDLLVALMYIATCLQFLVYVFVVNLSLGSRHYLKAL